jgi:uncharacterized membrane protein (DUF106 family)
MVFESILDPIFGPMLGWPPLLAMIVISLIISLIIVFVYKYLTNQKLMKEMKDQLKAYQKEMKGLRNNPKELMAVQKKAMELNMKYMTHSLKPTLITFLPIIIIYGWLSMHLAFYPIEAGQSFTTQAIFDEGVTGQIELLVTEEFTLLNNATQEIVNGTAEWELEAEKEGDYLLEYKYGEMVYTKEILITSEPEYKQPIRKIKDSDLEIIKVNNKPLKMINIFGFKLGWIWTYIIFSIAFSMILRKLLKVY